MSNSTPTLTLMAGLPGVGKTTLARALGEKLGWQVVYKDGRKEELLRGGLDDDTASRIAYDESFAKVRNILASKQSVILDTAALHSFILEEAQKIVFDMQKTRAQIRLKVLFLIVANRELRYQRIQHRPPQTTVIRFNPSTIDGYLDCFTHLPLPPGSFYLDTSTQQLDEYLERTSYYLTSDDEIYDDDEEDLKSKCKSFAVSNRA